MPKTDIQLIFDYFNEIFERKHGELRDLLMADYQKGLIQPEIPGKYMKIEVMDLEFFWRKKRVRPAIALHFHRMAMNIINIKFICGKSRPIVKEYQPNRYKILDGNRIATLHFLKKELFKIAPEHPHAKSLPIPLKGTPPTEDDNAQIKEAIEMNHANLSARPIQYDVYPSDCVELIDELKEKAGVYQKLTKRTIGTKIVQEFKKNTEKVYQIKLLVLRMVQLQDIFTRMMQSSFCRNVSGSCWNIQPLSLWPTWLVSRFLIKTKHMHG